MDSPVFFVGDININLLKQNNLPSKYSTLLEYNGVTQLLTIATRTTIDSVTLINHLFHNHFLDSTDRGNILDAGLPEHCATFVKLPFCCKKCDDTGTT